MIVFVPSIFLAEWYNLFKILVTFIILMRSDSTIKVAWLIYLNNVFIYGWIPVMHFPVLFTKVFVKDLIEVWIITFFWMSNCSSISFTDWILMLNQMEVSSTFSRAWRSAIFWLARFSHIIFSSFTICINSNRFWLFLVLLAFDEYTILFVPVVISEMISWMIDL